MGAFRGETQRTMSECDADRIRLFPHAKFVGKLAIKRMQNRAKEPRILSHYIFIRQFSLSRNMSRREIITNKKPRKIAGLNFIPEPKTVQTSTENDQVFLPSPRQRHIHTPRQESLYFSAKLRSNALH